MRRRDRHAPRQGRRPYRPAQRDRGFAGPHDGRQRGACGGARAGRRHRESRAAARDKQPEPQACHALLDAAPQHLAQRAGRGGHRHRRRRRQRPGRVLRGGVGRGDAARGRHDPHPRQGRRAAQHHRPSPARRGLRAGRASRARRGAAHEAVGEPVSVALRDRPQGVPRRRRAGQGRRDRYGGAAHHRSDGRQEKRARSRSRRTFGRQSAEIHHRPRARPPARP